MFGFEIKDRKLTGHDFNRKKIKPMKFVLPLEMCRICINFFE